MLPRLHYQAYQEFLAALLGLHNHLCGSSLEVASLQEHWQPVQQVFQSQITQLNAEGVDSAIASRWQSIQTEIYRSFRLLETDILFLQASRQAHTSEQRLKTVCDRLVQIISYCQGMI